MYSSGIVPTLVVDPADTAGSRDDPRPDGLYTMVQCRIERAITPWPEPPYANYRCPACGRRSKHQNRHNTDAPRDHRWFTEKVEDGEVFLWSIQDGWLRQESLANVGA